MRREIGIEGDARKWGRAEVNYSHYRRLPVAGRSESTLAVRRRVTIPTEKTEVMRGKAKFESVNSVDKKLGREQHEDLVHWVFTVPGRTRGEVCFILCDDSKKTQRSEAAGKASGYGEGGGKGRES